MKIRNHHYVYAHIALRQIFLADPERFLSALHQDGVEFLEHVWGVVAERLPPEEALAAEGLEFGFQMGSDAILAILRMPPAEADAEAVLVGCYLRKVAPGAKLEPSRARYFTLEKGTQSDGTPRTVLCEWEGEGEHENYGDGPPAEVEAFAAAIRAQVRDPGLLN